MRKAVVIDFEKCRPAEHGGVCLAAEACTHGLLEQEEHGETPMLLSATMCVGCARCVDACPLGALEVKSGH